MTTATATFKRLRTGQWGLNVKSLMAPFKGMTVTATTRNGRSESLTLGTILWQAVRDGQHVAIGTIGRAEPATVAPAVPAPEPVLLVPGLFTFLGEAKAKGLKEPKLRILGPDDKSELRIGFARRYPEALAVVLADKFIGYLRPDGKMSHHGLQGRIDVQQRLLAVSTDPRAEAKRYAVINCKCSFCNLPLTDAGSVEAGYGPVCADHWGLPHVSKGSIAPVAVAS